MQVVVAVVLAVAVVVVAVVAAAVVMVVCRPGWRRSSPLGVFPKRGGQILSDRHEQPEVKRMGLRTLHQHTRFVRSRCRDDKQPSQRPSADTVAGLARGGFRAARACSNPTHDRVTATAAAATTAAATHCVRSIQRQTRARQLRTLFHVTPTLTPLGRAWCRCQSL